MKEHAQKVFVITAIVLVLLVIILFTPFNNILFGKAIGDAQVVEIDPQFTCDFENRLGCDDGVVFGASEGISFVEGFRGRALNLPRGEYIGSSTAEIEMGEGSVELWFNPQNDEGGTIFLTRPDVDDELHLLAQGRTVVLRMRSTERGRSSDSEFWDETSWMNMVATADAQLRVGEWNHVALSWKRSEDRSEPDEFHVFVDGRELAMTVTFRTSISEVLNEEDLNGFNLTRKLGNLVTLPQSLGQRIFIGHPDKVVNAGFYDDLKIYDTIKRAFCPYCTFYPEGPLFFQKPLFGGQHFQTDITTSTKPLPEEIIRPENGFDVSATSGESEPLSFAVYAHDASIDNVDISISDLESNEGTISSTNVDIRVVKVWDQMGMGGLSYNTIGMSGSVGGRSDIQWADFGVHDKSGIAVPELLVYNDLQELAGRVDPATNEYFPPRISRTFRTSIPQDTSKQFWLDFDIPEDASPGEYSGVITVDLDGNEVQVPVRLNVLPFSLLDSSINRWIFYRFTPLVGGEDNQYEIISEDLMRAHFEDIRAHGFNGLIWTKDFEIKTPQQRSLASAQRDRFFALAREARFENVVQACDTTQCEDISTRIEVARRYGFESLLYGPDESNSFDKDSFFSTLQFIDNVHNQGARIVMTVSSETAQEYGNPESVMYDVHRIPPGTSTSGLQLRDSIVGDADFLEEVQVRELFPDLGEGEEEGTWARIELESADLHKIKDNEFVTRLEGGEYRIVGEIIGGDVDSPDVVFGKILFEETPSLRFTHPELVGIAPDILIYANVLSRAKDGDERADFDASVLRGEPSNLAGETYSYWQIGENRLKYNRFRSGVAAWLSNLDGISPFAYQHYGLPGQGYGLPYEEFSTDYDPLRGYSPPQMTTYPYAGGSVPTLEWKALREGIDDYRYLVTLDHVLESIRDSDPALHQSITREFESALRPFRNVLSWYSLSDQDFADLRTFVVEKILELDLDFGEVDEDVILGDINSDSCVDETDVRAIIDFIDFDCSPPGVGGELLGDTNADGCVDETDVRAIIPLIDFDCE